MSKTEEHVLVIPAADFINAGTFHGFCADVPRYLPKLLANERLQFLPRSEAEVDPRFKQIIPYVVFRCGELLFHYQRGGGSGEQRLRSLRSLGIGGHISREDAAGGEDLYRTGMLREIAEEVEVGSAYQEQCVGLINDDSTEVGRVHLGIVHIFDLQYPQIHAREEHLLAAGFAPLQTLRTAAAEFETWSQCLFAADIF